MSRDGPPNHTEMLTEEEGCVLKEYEIHMK